MGKKLALVFLWFLATPIALISLGILFHQHSLITNLTKIASTFTNGESAKTTQINGEVLGIEISDMRPYYVENFLKGTRLEPYSHYIVAVSDKYNLDYRLIPAIAMRESNGGNAVKEESHNAWGWENGRTYFDSWEVAIETVGKTLRERYADRGLITPEQIMPVYAPPQVEKGGKWAQDINHFFEKLQSL